MNPLEIIQKQKFNPKEEANIFSLIFFWWLKPLMMQGYVKNLEIKDLYRVLQQDSSHELVLDLESSWTKELNKVEDGGEGKKKKQKPSFLTALLHTFGRKFMLIGILTFVGECITKICTPIFLGRLLRYFELDSEMTTLEAYLYATGIVLSSLLFILMSHPQSFASQHIGMQMRVAASNLMYKKSLRLSKKATTQINLGKIMNIMANDVNRFDQVTMFLHSVWYAPVQTIVVASILCYNIGPSCLVGLASLIFFIPIQGLLSRMLTKLRLETAKRTDERLRLMNEIITGIKLIKMYTWENPFAKLIEDCRRNEAKYIRWVACYQGTNMSLFLTYSKLAIFLTFLVFVLTGNPLTAEQVFLTVALLNVVRTTMTLSLPVAIAMASETWVSIKRIEEYLLLDEKNERHENDHPGISSGPSKVILEQVTVKWPAPVDMETKALEDVSFRLRSGELFVIVGQVGSGKSTLLNVILGELVPLKGSCKVDGRISYASQEPWIFSGTIRENILCGLNYDESRYNKVVKAVALELDFCLLPHGDTTVVGERGVSLSGGQKARINLARCLYIDADIYLMDDPLSAVDTRVGRHMFNEAIKGFLQDKIRVLVTHQLQYLKDADKILVLDGGKMEAYGSYQKLGLDFLKIKSKASEGNSFPDGHELTSMEEPFLQPGPPGLSELLPTGTLERQESAKMTKLEEKPMPEEESRSSGSVSLAVYWQYFSAGLSTWSAFILIINFIVGQVLFHGSEYWLAAWTDAEEFKKNTRNKSLHASYENSSSHANNMLKNSSIVEDLDIYTAIYVFTGLTVGVFLFSILRTVHLFVACVNSSISLHNKMFNSIIRAPLLFFDENPVGRVLNRFSKDLGLMDERLSATYFDVISIPLTVIGITVLVGLANPWLVLPVIVMVLITLKMRSFFLKTAQDIKRLEATTKSPVFTHLAASLAGLTTIRANKCQSVFQSIFDQCQDVHSSAWYLYLATTRWLSVWMDWLCALYLTCVTYTCVALRDSITGSQAGLAISSASLLMLMVQFGVRQSAELENQMTSVERVIEYGDLPSEAATTSNPENKPPHDWPQKGAILFDKMCLRYKKSGLPVLKNITCQIKSREKVGIVGRTGAGKSSLIVALFRLTEPEGLILIDGIDTKTIGLHDLRSKISIIPQDPVLFSGTLRRNLDPFGEFEDEELWNAIREVKLKESMVDMPAGLDFLLAEGGSNLSVGQKQLVCLARAILRKNTILVLDEATANIDQTTDALIQLTIREKFRNCTVLTIAHRLNTIMDSDRVMVMDDGCLKEFDNPVTLLEYSDSIFARMVQQTGPINASQLINLARVAADKKRSNKNLTPVEESIQQNVQVGGAKEAHWKKSGTHDHSYTNDAFDRESLALEDSEAREH